MRGLQRTVAAGVMLAGLGVLTGVAISSGTGTEPLVAHRVPPVEVRTEVIRKTVNVYRRERPHHAAGSSPGGTGTSTGVATPAVLVGRTRTSGPASSSGASAPVVRTHTSGSASTGKGGGAPRTRTSGGGDGGGGGHDD